ncbi:MAG: tripartite tricarboxylate transporter TctB family protein [Rhodobacteraceae bacterium]|nr:tripartite tricarboxylate transporter TctB family protein [Paracoccaceae bacterium]
MNRMQHIIPSGIVALVGIWVAYVSYTQTPAEAFLFPRLIATVFVILALWTFGKAVLGLSKVGSGVSVAMCRNLVPGLLVMVVYVFWAAKGLGFYTGTAIAFFVALSLYDPAPHGAVKSWVKRLVITVGFIAVMYALFAVVLKVWTPKEVLF